MRSEIPSRKVQEKKEEKEELEHKESEKPKVDEEKEYRKVTDAKLNELLDSLVLLEKQIKEKDGIIKERETTIASLKDKQEKVRTLAGVGDVSA